MISFYKADIIANKINDDKDQTLKQVAMHVRNLFMLLRIF